jgi:hypothetical protein
MKFSLIALAAAALASTALASPFPTPAELAERDTCNHPGHCGWFESGQCEYDCDGYGGFTKMQSCGWGRKRCCCKVHT